MPVLPLNTVVHSYRIEKLVGSGGMGEVYRATNLQTRTQVAVKALSATGGAGTALARFRNEAVIQYNLHHPNVAELFEYFEYQGKPCIVMEFVEGRTLAEWLRDAGPLELSKALEIMADICDAVSYMHAKGTIHRDIKSENIRITAQGKAKLLDFGISVSRYSPSLTKTGYSIGTPEKMAPEQHLGLRGDARSDVWSLGVLLYEMVTGALPFASSSEAGLREDIVASRFISVTKRRPTLPRGVSRIIANCLKVKPDERYNSAGVMLRDIQQLRRNLHTEQWYSRFAHPATVAGGLAVLAILLLVLVLRPTPPSPVPAGAQEPSISQAPPGDPAPRTRPASAPDRPAVQPPPDPAGPALAPRDFSLPQPSPAAPAGPAPRTDAAPPPAAASNIDSKTVVVSTYDGPAEVTDVTSKQTRQLGQTPVRLTAPRGTSYELILSRPGFQSRVVDVEINNKNEYLFGLDQK